ncbi:MAG: hypothetical protein ACE5JL_00210 [Dehalococcoidia bacterium]
MKKSLLLFIVALFTIAGPDPSSARSHAYVAADSAVNNVAALFRTAWIYDSSEDTFTNAQVTGRKWWQATLQNGPDETGAPVSALALSLESALAFDNLQRENLVTPGPPTYEWSFGDVPEGSGAGAWVDSLHDSNPVPVTFTPGFDASRSTDKSEFTGPDTQTLTITLTPREVTEGFSVLVQAEENDMVNPVITSAEGEGILLRQEGHSLHIEPTGLQRGTNWAVTVTIEVTPKAPKVVFLPYVMIGWEGEVTASGAETGSSLSRPLGDLSDEAGTWTWSAEGTYEWRWEERLSRAVYWLPTSRPAEGVRGPLPGSTPIAEPGNHVVVNFVSNWIHGVDSDSFVNAEVTGQKQWRISAIVNTPDTTGAPVTGLKVTLESGLAFDWVRQVWLPSRPGRLTKMGPPVYEWAYDDVPEGTLQGGLLAYDAYVGFLRHTSERVTPGFDVSRSFDKTVFTAPDTQTMTLTVTPREERVTNISITLSTSEDDRVDPMFISLTGGENGRAGVAPGGRTADVYDIPAELNTPVTVTATIKITPKVPAVEYKPVVRVTYWLPDEPSFFTTEGDSFSYKMDAVGTWTVSAEGDYVWHWAVHSPRDGVASYSVALDGKSEQLEAPMRAPAATPTPGPTPTPKPGGFGCSASAPVAQGSISGGAVFLFTMPLALSAFNYFRRRGTLLSIALL